MIKSDVIDNIKAVGGGLILIYYIKTTIDNWYTNKEKLIDNIEYNKKCL
jgi:hypothetical protein